MERQVFLSRLLIRPGISVLEFGAENGSTALQYLCNAGPIGQYDEYDMSPFDDTLHMVSLQLDDGASASAETSSGDTPVSLVANR
ncbi:hypothetical protein BDV10DRAFT_163545 [Aspergillus recurvatus]